jgi:hypothetical protein
MNNFDYYHRLAIYFDLCYFLARLATLNMLPWHFKVNADHYMFLLIDLILSKDYLLDFNLIFVLNLFLIIFLYLVPLLLLFVNDYLLYFLLFLLIGFENSASIRFCQNLSWLGLYLVLTECFEVESCYLVLNSLLLLNFVLMELIFYFDSEY